MVKPRRRELTRGLHASMAVAKATTCEEKEFVSAFAHALSHATVSIIANPELPVTPGSIADRVRDAYSRFRPDRRGEIQERALSRLSGPIDQRQRYFGAYAERGPEVWSRAEPGLDRELRQKLREAVRARLNTQRRDIAECLSVASAIELYVPASVFPKTTLVVGYFQGDAQAEWTSLTITSPVSIDLKWNTTAANAEMGSLATL